MIRFLMLCALCLGGLRTLADEQSFRARQAQNPLANLMKYELETRLDFEYGSRDAVNYTTSIRPAMAASVSKDWKLISRLDLPVGYQPGRSAGEKDSWGLGDTTYESFFVPAGPSRWTVGLGPSFQIPTATDPQLGTRKWSAGLAAAAHGEAGPFTFGLRANQLWSFAGKAHRDDVNRTAFEYWLYANLGRGWWIGTAPVNIADWEAAAENRWTVPVGGGIGKVVGRRIPLNLKCEAYAYAEVPNDLAEWSLLFSFEFLLPENALFKR